MARWSDFELALLVALRSQSVEYDQIRDYITSVLPTSQRTPGSLRGKIFDFLENNTELYDTNSNTWRIEEVAAWIETLRLTGRQMELARECSNAPTFRQCDAVDNWEGINLAECEGTCEAWCRRSNCNQRNTK
ncbi:hypothetical protein K469DRAFT_752106 [Zopfia rhizophila CBS 207.26]|uniref:Uncharacterized protein n=1 Tax=Zopfia rhizophila CBS 207.26 TaxID=1314779 RepID=A0A6A6DXE9_9PEZI|nr:hypothetical protein K469DRAFT_752106 [Zopfia rhizophila CBS 207.26]